MSYSLDGYIGETAASAPASARAAFIKRTYLHLAGALLAFVGIEAALIGSGVATDIVVTLFAQRAAWIGLLVLFIAGGFLAVGSLMSSLTRNQLIAFLLAAWLSFLFLLAGFPVVTDWLGSWAPQWLVTGITSLSFLTHFENITRGVLDLRDVLYYALVTVFFLLASTVVLEARKSK